ncbi:MAG: hypothetical protein KDA99_07825 [Planctomycetales bacterium]|nr:hypothetical protein [Planctomycetales bacterium]
MNAPLDPHTTVDLDTAFARLYSNLKRLSRALLRRYPAHPSLCALDLLHLTYVYLSRSKHSFNWANNRQFFADAASRMRNIVIDHLRGKCTLKRGGGLTRLPHDAIYDVEARRCLADLGMLQRPFDDLKENYPEWAEVVELKYLVGLTIPEIASILSIPQNVIERRWTAARAYLKWRRDIEVRNDT